MPSTSYPSAFDNELNALTREFKKDQPEDHLQFCANYFLRRLEAQRAEFLLSATHQSKGGRAGTAMAESNFPGSNPFGGGGSGGAKRGMTSLEEEEENDTVASPTATQFNNPNFGSLNSAADGSNEPAFGSTGFMSGQRMAPMDGANNLPSNYNFNRRTSVSAESMNPAETASDNWSPPVHQKTPEQQSRLRAAVSHNFLFSHLDDEQSNQVLGALQEKSIPAKGIKVISQGDSGDYFYVVEKGAFDVYVNSSGQLEAGADGMGKQVGSVGPSGSFGELALMYNAPRAATVVSTEASTLWALDRLTFRRILMENAFQRRRMYESFLAEVKLFEGLTPYERSKIADALHTEKFPSGHTIIREGDQGEAFFIIESGEAEVYKRGTDQPVNKYQKGDYFGELALLDDKPRAASVISSSEVKLATLGKEGFQRLLGPVENIMRRNDPTKRAAMDGDDVDPLS